jgi:hypothetical protein
VGRGRLKPRTDNRRWTLASRPFLLGVLRWFPTLFSGLRLVFTLVVALIGAGGVVALIPRVSMSPGSTLDPLDPFATPFGLKNDGYQTLSKITFACGVNYLDTATRPPRRRDSPEIGLEMARIFGIARFAAQLLAFRGGQTKGRPAGGRPLFSARP